MSDAFYIAIPSGICSVCGKEFTNYTKRVNIAVNMMDHKYYCKSCAIEKAIEGQKGEINNVD